MDPSDNETPDDLPPNVKVITAATGTFAEIIVEVRQHFDTAIIGELERLVGRVPTDTEITTHGVLLCMASSPLRLMFLWKGEPLIYTSLDEDHLKKTGEILVSMNVARERDEHDDADVEEG